MFIWPVINIATNITIYNTPGLFKNSGLQLGYFRGTGLPYTYIVVKSKLSPIIPTRKLLLNTRAV
jgi:hypothetical protein